MSVATKELSPSLHDYPITVLQSKETRAMNVGYIKKGEVQDVFIPGRLLYGPLRSELTYRGTIQTLQTQQAQDILSRYKPNQISTVTLLRETIACRLDGALYAAGIRNHFGDAFIGATHIKGDGAIRTAYLYENTEGLTPDGLWVIGESFCIGRNLIKTMDSLLAKFHPKEILFIAPLASRRGINAVGERIALHKVPTSFFVWGALFGVDEKTLYDMPWGHKDTEVLDKRDRDTFISIYGPQLCVGGDFGNNYYSPTIAKKLYEDQLKEHAIKPHIPLASEIYSRYKTEEIFTEE